MAERLVLALLLIIDGFTMDETLKIVGPEENDVMQREEEKKNVRIEWCDPDNRIGDCIKS